MSLAKKNAEEIFKKITYQKSKDDNQQYPACTCYYGCLQKIFDKPACHHYQQKKNKSKQLPIKQKEKISLSFKKRNSNKKQQNPHSNSTSKKENSTQCRNTQYNVIHMHQHNKFQSTYPVNNTSSFKFFKPKQKFTFENLPYTQNVSIKTQPRQFRNTSYISSNISFKKQINQSNQESLKVKIEQSIILQKSVESTQCSYLKNLQTDFINFDKNIGKTIEKEEIAIPSPMIYSEKQSEDKISSVSLAISSSKENQNMKKISWAKTRDKALTFFDQNASDRTIEQYSMDQICKLKKNSSFKADSVFGVSLKSLNDKSIKEVSSIQDSPNMSQYSEVISRTKIQDRKTSARLIKQYPSHKRKSSYVVFSEFLQPIYDNQSKKFQATK